MSRVRKAAAARFASLPLPTEALEEWRYSRIDSLELDSYTPALAPGSSPARSDRSAIDTLTASIGALGALIETVDGHLFRSDVRSDAIQVTVESAEDAAPSDGNPVGGGDPFAVLNEAFAPSPIRIRVPRGGSSDPVVILHWATTDDVACFPRLQVELADDAEVSVVEIVAGPGRALVVPVTTLDLAPASRLGYLHVQDLGSTAWQIGWQASRLGRDATLTSAAVALGGDYARLRTDSSLEGTGASSRLLALYFAAGTQMHDFRTIQGHRAPKTLSDLLYKGAVANSSRSVYSGLIRVDKGARGSNAFQTNRNLVLHEGAHADSVPNLEIEENDVRCSHASAVGPIDEDQRFYLESRGVPVAIADRLISIGFLGEVLEQIPVPSAGPVLRSKLTAKLEHADAAQVVA